MGRDEMVREKMTPKLGGGSGMSRVYFSVESEVKSYLKKDLKETQMEEISRKFNIKGYN